MELRYAMIFCTTRPDGVRNVLAAAEAPGGRVFRSMHYTLPDVREQRALPEGKAHVPHMVVLEEHTRYGTEQTVLDLRTEEEALQRLANTLPPA